MATFETVYASLPTEPHAKGAAFERLCQWWLETDPVYTEQLRQVWLWDDWPGRWGPDTGIDLVAETHTGDLWAIQAKAYDTKYSVTKADIDSFLSESNRPAFAYRLLVATTDRIGANGRRVLQGQEKDVGLLLRGDLAARDVEWPEQVSDLRAPQPAAKRPRPHQEEALAKIVAGVGTGGRGRVIMACGTGKTLVQLWAHERLESRRTLVLVPSLFLVQQSLAEWTANRQRPFRSLAVCSDKTVVQRRDDDAIIESVNEQGLLVTTDPTEIQTFLLQGDGDQVVFSTYQSSARVAEAQGRGRFATIPLQHSDEPRSSPRRPRERRDGRPRAWHRHHKRRSRRTWTPSIRRAASNSRPRWPSPSCICSRTGRRSGCQAALICQT